MEFIMTKLQQQVPTLLGVLITGLFMWCSVAHADIDRSSKKKGNQTQARTFRQNDLQQNTASAVQFYTTNYGIFGLNVSGNTGGGFWPRNSGNQYIFGGGVWFGAVKMVGTDTVPHKLSVISYNPNSGSSWMAPGRIEDGDSVMETSDAILKYRTYIATDFNPDGTPRNSADGPNWAIWDTAPISDSLSFLLYNKKQSRYFGNYVYDITKRNKESMPKYPDGQRKGPVFVSSEDIISVYKDTDLRNYEDGVEVAKSKGYPMRLQFEQTVYSWAFGLYRNFIFLRYAIINKSNDTLRECWMAPAYDFDLANARNGQAGAGNDHVNYYSQDPTLNLAFQWSETNSGEKGRGFGYLGMDFLESPAVDGNRFLRKDASYYPNSEQIGLKTFRNWVIAIDPTNDVARYDFMAYGKTDGDNGAGDKRFLMATGPFNMLPNDTARVVVGVIFAPTAKGGEATGDSADLTELILRDKFAQSVYDNAFATPKPPDVGPITWEPLNNGVIIRWDNTAEKSVDREERGFDFLGYRLYRARVNNLDTFDLDERRPDGTYPLGRGIFGWKQIAAWECPPLFSLSTIRTDSSSSVAPFFPYCTVLQGSGSKAACASRYPSFLTTGDVNSATTYLILRSPNLTDEPWRSFWLPIYPNAAKGDTLFRTANEMFERYTVGVVRVRPNGIPPKALATGATAADSLVFFKTLWKLLGESKAQLTWMTEGLEDSSFIRDRVLAYMDSVTHGRVFVDYGDDNGDGVITEDPDIRRTEKLINNVDYYYKLLAYDEGDIFQNTPQKLNVGIEKINSQQTFPLAAAVGKNSVVTSVSVDNDKIGGLYNFRLLVKDQDRFNELYGGHEIELKFNHGLSVIGAAYPFVDTLIGRLPPDNKGIYSTEMTVRDKTTGKVIGQYPVDYEPGDCQFAGRLSEFAIVQMSPNGKVFENIRTLLVDSNDVRNFAHPLNTDALTRYGTFTTDKTCLAPNRFINGTIGFAFDYAVQQLGGVFRPLSATITSGTANSVVAALKTPLLGALLTQGNTTTGRFEKYNNGSGEYEIEFLPGGTETITTSVNNKGPQSYEVSYLNMRVRNIATYKRETSSGEMVDVKYGMDIPHAAQTLPVTLPGTVPVQQKFPDARFVPIGSYNMSAYGWLNGRYDSTTISSKDGLNPRKVQATNDNSGEPVGQQGRYYLSTITGTDTLDFTHVVLIDGATYILDFPAKGGRVGGFNGRLLTERPAVMPTQDFKAGDKVVVSTTGGARGLPYPGATVTFKISPSEVAANDMTDDIMGDIIIVPNPYFVSHIGQRSSYDAKIYFMHLPKECTIRIFTLGGDLVRTIQHVDEDGTSRQAMDVWDLLSDNKQRAASQSLIAEITTPNGAKTIKKFSVVVGGARVLGR